MLAACAPEVVDGIEDAPGVVVTGKLVEVIVVFCWILDVADVLNAVLDVGVEVEVIVVVDVDDVSYTHLLSPSGLVKQTRSSFLSQMSFSGLQSTSQANFVVVIVVLDKVVLVIVVAVVVVVEVAVMLVTVDVVVDVSDVVVVVAVVVVVVSVAVLVVVSIQPKPFLK